jgi:hypothetical protein
MMIVLIIVGFALLVLVAGQLAYNGGVWLGSN